MSQTVALAIVALLLTLALAGRPIYTLRLPPRATVQHRAPATFSPGGAPGSGSQGGAC